MTVNQDGIQQTKNISYRSRLAAGAKFSLAAAALVGTPAILGGIGAPLYDGMQSLSTGRSAVGAFKDLAGANRMVARGVTCPRRPFHALTFRYIVVSVHAGTQMTTPVLTAVFGRGTSSNPPSHDKIVQAQIRALASADIPCFYRGPNHQ